jgi:DNA topoisomerase VI subunit B
VVNQTTQRLDRPVFTTSRNLDFLNRAELVAQTGHGPDQWPLVVLKELTDNALDDAEEAGTAPVIAIEVTTDPGTIMVSDNGTGIAAKVVRDTLNFDMRVSSREAFTSPTRGAQGNALKTILAIPFVLTEGQQDRRGETVIESHGVAHHIVFAADLVRNKVEISRATERSVVKTGTRITVRWPQMACHLLKDAETAFFQMAQTFGLLNPHLKFKLTWDGEVLYDLPPTNSDWKKWCGSDPIPADWYDQGGFERLIAAYLNDDIEHKRERTLREFVSTFRGLSGSAKQAEVLDQAGLGRPALASLYRNGQPDHDAIERLLRAMQAYSRPPTAEMLGVIGREHMEWSLGDDTALPENFRYRRVSGVHDGLPYVIEIGFAADVGDNADDREFRGLYGVNFSPALNQQPFRFRVDTLTRKLAQRSIYPTSPVDLVIHYTTPRPQFTDRGKSAIALPPDIESEFDAALHYVTAHWARTEEAQERAMEREERESQRRVREAAKPKRERSEVVGSGVLHKEIAAAAAKSGWSINELTVLSPSNDPFRLDNTAKHKAGKWFADQIERLLASAAQVHLRGLFYRIVSVEGGIAKPDGKIFVNTDANWRWLINTAAKAARYLGYTPFETIVDERTAEPYILIPSEPPCDGKGYFEAGDNIEIPGLVRLLPRVGADAPRGKQPYRIILLGEKVSLREVLHPIAQQVHGELLLLTGESTDTRINEMLKRAAADERPAVILYFTDFDPAGHQMALSVARKLQAMRILLYPNLQIELHRVALTLTQVREFGLPSSPIKATEKRKSKWTAAMGHEQTEIDALAALRPDDLRRIALDAVRPFFDFGLEERCQKASEAWRKEAEAKLLDHPAYAEAERQITAAHAEVKAAVEALEQVQADTYDELKDQLGIEDTEIPMPETRIKAAAPVPLFTTDDDFVTATRKLIAEKKYEFEDDGTDDDPDDDGPDDDPDPDPVITPLRPLITRPGASEPPARPHITRPTK